MDGIKVKDSPSEAVIEGCFENMVTLANAEVRFLASCTAATKDTSPIPGEPELKRLPLNRRQRARQ